MSAAAPSSSSSAGALPFAAPTPGASLLLSHTPASSQTILIIGSSNLASSRTLAALEAGLKPVLFPVSTASQLTEELRWRVLQRQVDLVQPSDGEAEGEGEGDGNGDALLHADPHAWNALIDKLDQQPLSTEENDEHAPRLFAICVTDTLTSSNNAAPPSSSSPSAKSPLDLALARAALLATICRKRRILLNVADRPQLCTFSFPAVHRFQLVQPPPSNSVVGSTPAPTASSLQIAITTNGKGCRLASRIRREIVSALPRNVGDAVETVGWLRSLAKDELRLPATTTTTTTPRVTSSSRFHAASGLRQEDNVDGQSTPRRKSSIGAPSVKESDATSYFTPQIEYTTAAPTTTAARQLARQVDEEDTSYDPQPLNSPVPQLSYNNSNNSRAGTAAPVPADPEQAQRRMRWVSQISEYWPIEYLGSLRSRPEEMRELLDTYGGAVRASPSSSRQPPPPPLPPAAAQQVDAPSFISPFGGEKVHPPYVEMSNDIDEAQDRALRAAHDSMRRRSEAASIVLPAADGGEKQVEGEDDDAARGRSNTRPETRSTSSPNPARSESVHSLSLTLPASAHHVPAKGHVYLLGSGPGHPGLLTQFAYALLTSPSTDLILSDKLVPSSILALIPRSTPVEIARKFPGNAEAAQSELIEKALEAAQEGSGKIVVRLKQGDPFVYGRGGEEVLAFRAAGVGCTVVPGISSAFAGPLMLGIAVTQRGAADTFVLCTGVGRGGKSVALPGYSRSTTLALLMGVARLKAMVHTLTSTDEGAESTEGGGRRGKPFPPYLPVAIIERASSADQRLVASTLENIVGALERCGEQRPPGMILVGWTVLALEGEKGDASILDDGEVLGEGSAELERKDRDRVQRWLGGRGYVVREGLDQAYAEAAMGFLANGGR
ncbi:unnamed protein product [Tilletia laevis]|uniref:precorrin-2 dehydrogenase n=2 Tax=Tilletia TaxID=13289 RepID=A0A177ULV8_9BASI|nr:hypothetical protein CF335_g2132 [Tilletia laevis]KAE8263447.1 hypothetical protein A4X03_0g1672 [Tilletia caries]CAD6892407.1 unnamed protein product [Tilletia caries]CAD6901966.1 unnamed protein product [Tilletia laevis]CAD6930761.1 unnamed protein product [Tilletia caries]